MRLLIVNVACCVVFCITVSAFAEPQGDSVRTIRLDRIWALDMEGTRNIHDLEKDRSIGEGYVDEIVRALIDIGHDLRRKQKPANPGFAVEGDGAIALQCAHAVLVDRTKPTDTITAGTDATLVFFSYLAGVDVQVREVEVRGNTIELKYRFIYYTQKILSTQFALIPLGKLAAGKYEVKLTQLPAVGGKGKKDYKEIVPPRHLTEAGQLVSQQFTFEVVNPKD